MEQQGANMILTVQKSLKNKKPQNESVSSVINAGNLNGNENGNVIELQTSDIGDHTTTAVKTATMTTPDKIATINENVPMDMLIVPSEQFPESTQNRTTKTTPIADNNSKKEIIEQGWTDWTNNSKKHSSFMFKAKSFVVTMNPRLLSLFLLAKSIWPRLLGLLDIYTDIQVSISLFSKKSYINIVLFTLSVIFMLLPYVIAWSVSLRFFQKYFEQQRKKQASSKNDDENSRNNDAPVKLIENFIVMYLFPPFGCIVIAVYEIYYLLYEIYRGLRSFIRNEILTIDLNPEKNAIKNFRTIVTFFGESFPQLLLQSCMFIFDIKVNSADLIISILISIFHLSYNLYNLRKEAKYHGMSFAEYGISVLHLGAFPISKLVPRLAGIETGIVKHVNYGNFSFDKQSIGSVMEGLSSNTCKIQSLRISIHTLKLLDFESCHTLATFLKRKKINVIISQTSDSQEIYKLFRQLDKKNKGYLNEDEFNYAWKIMKSLINVNNNVIGNGSHNASSNIFKQLAIRRGDKRDRVYFLDFFDSFARAKQDVLLNDNIDYVYDITSIEYPIHFIFDYLATSVEYCFNNENEQSHQLKQLGKLVNLPQTIEEWFVVLDKHLFRLYHFGIGLNYQLQLRPLFLDNINGNNNKKDQNIFITILLSYAKIEKIKNNSDNKKWNELIEDEIPLSTLIIWFFDKILSELTQNVASTIDLICQKCQCRVADEPDTVEVDCLELALRLKNYRYFVILCNVMFSHEASKDVNSLSFVENWINNHIANDEDRLSLICIAIELGYGDMILWLLNACFSNHDSNHFKAEYIPQLLNQAIVGSIYPRTRMYLLSF